jgi:hypothetical protein
MPKLDGTHLPSRLASRLDELKAGKEVAARDIRALLTDEQIAEMDAAWAAQQELRKKKRARTKEEEQELGWKTKRDIYIEAYERALKAAQESELEALEQRMFKAEVRQARVFLDAFFAKRDEGREWTSAWDFANNELTRAGLPRVDRQGVRTESRRDREVREMEEQLRKKFEAEMTDYEREQLELLREHEKALQEQRKKQRR